MTLTTEQIEQILAGAPEGATHVEVDIEGFVNYYQHDIEEMNWSVHPAPGVKSRSWRIGIPELIVEYFYNLSDLLEISTLRQRVEELERKKSEVAARAVESGLDWLNSNYPNACQPACGLLQHYANQLRGQGDE